jgi:hypothetical protein
MNGSREIPEDLEVSVSEMAWQLGVSGSCTLSLWGRHLRQANAPPPETHAALPRSLVQ